MARLIEDHVYRVSLDSERNYVYVSAKDSNELIHFLADEFAGKQDVYGVKEVCRDGSLATVPVVTNSLFKELCEQKIADRDCVKPGLNQQIEQAELKRISSSGKSEQDKREML